MVNTRRADLDDFTPEYLYKNKRLCSEHFEDGQFMNVQSRNRLIPNAIPTLFKVPNPPAKITLSRPRQKRQRLDEQHKDDEPGMIIYIEMIMILCHTNLYTQSNAILKKMNKTTYISLITCRM